jgi:hypothetical protein
MVSLQEMKRRVFVGKIETLEIPKSEVIQADTEVKRIVSSLVQKIATFRTISISRGPVTLEYTGREILIETALKQIHQEFAELQKLIGEKYQIRDKEEMRTILEHLGFEVQQ